MDKKDSRARVVTASISALVLMLFFAMLFATTFVYVAFYLYSGSDELFFGSSDSPTVKRIALTSVIVGLVSGVFTGKKIWVYIMRKSKFVSESFIKSNTVKKK